MAILSVLKYLKCEVNHFQSLKARWRRSYKLLLYAIANLLRRRFLFIYIKLNTRLEYDSMVTDKSSPD